MSMTFKKAFGLIAASAVALSMSACGGAGGDSASGKTEDV